MHTLDDVTSSFTLRGVIHFTALTSCLELNINTSIGTIAPRLRHQMPIPYTSASNTRCSDVAKVMVKELDFIASPRAIVHRVARFTICNTSESGTVLQKDFTQSVFNQQDL
jgi:hypothetical protein